MTAAISKITWLGIAKEGTPGTFVAPTRYVPTHSTIKAPRKPVYSDEDRNSRDKNFLAVYGPRQGGMECKGRWFNDSCVDFLYGWMGGISSANPSGPVYKHSLTMADTPPAWSLGKAYKSQGYKITYAGVEKFTLSVTPEKTIDYDVTFLGHFPINYSTPPSPSFTADPGFAGYLPTLTLTSLGASTTDIIDLKISLSQKIELWNPIAGSADFTTMYFGDREVDIDFTARFDVSTLFDSYWATPTDDSLTFDVLGAQIGASTLVTLGAQSSGTFTLTYGGQTTTGLAYGALASAVQTAVRLLSSVDAGCLVTGGAGGPYTIQNTGPMAPSTLLWTGSGASLTTPGNFSVAAPTLYNQELNLVFPTMNYESFDWDESKTNVMIKAKCKVRPDPTQVNAIMTAFVQNLIANYTTG